MRPEPSHVQSPIELTMMGLQQERRSCVSRLCALLERGGASLEAEGYMRRLDNINAALIRLSRFEIAY